MFVLNAGSLYSTQTDTDNTLRIDMDTEDPSFPCPLGGQTYIILVGGDVPASVRSVSGSFRVVYMATSWETGADPTTLSCGPGPVVSPPPCDSRLPVLAPVGRSSRGTSDAHASLSAALSAAIPMLPTHGIPFILGSRR